VNILDFFNGKGGTHELDERRGFDEDETCEWFDFFLERPKNGILVFFGVVDDDSWSELPRKKSEISEVVVRRRRTDILYILQSK
jgi:hypothetical protein